MQVLDAYALMGDVGGMCPERDVGRGILHVPSCFTPH
jgi:hypothetical protein